MKALFIPLQVLALIGFALSVFVHGASIFGIRAFAGADALHIGIFVVFIPAMLANYKLFQGAPVRQRELWKLMLRGCPAWMVTFTKVLFGYTILNFVYFFVMASSGHAENGTDGSMSPETLRGFSGHWMVFYWMAFAILYSAAHVKGPIVPNCAGCGQAVSPFDKFCSHCGRPVTGSSPS